MFLPVFGLGRRRLPSVCI